MRALVAVAVLALLVVPAAAQRHMELIGSPILQEPIPPDCSDWHELHPNFCLVDHQDAYEDNGDGFVSACDVIILGGTRYHVDWAGPTYWLVPVNPGDEQWMEPTIPDPGQNPIGEIWHEVAPDYCMEWEVLDWEDNGDGVLSPCDIIWFTDGPYHLAEIGLNIEITEEPSPIEQSTWGKIKAFFGM